MPGDGTNLVDAGAGDDILLWALGNNLLVGDGNDKLLTGSENMICDEWNNGLPISQWYSTPLNINTVNNSFF